MSREPIRMECLGLARAYLVDLDGTLICGGRALPGAAGLVRALAGRFVLVSNDGEHTPWQLAKTLSRCGLPIPPTNILLAGATAIDVIARERPGARVFLLGSRALYRYAQRAGLQPVRDDPDVVLAARDRHFSYGKLSAAANAVRAGAELIATNPDIVHPGANGSVVPETGALVQAIAACAGVSRYRVIGKPEAELFNRGLEILGRPAAEVAMIGDNPATDGLGATRLGMRFLPIEQVLPRPVQSVSSTRQEVRA